MKSLLPLIVFAAVSQLCPAGLQFDALLKEVHLEADESEAITEFHFSNPTDKTITISRYDATCSCMNAQVQGGKLTYAPGEKGVLKTVFDLGHFSGVVDKQLLLYLEGDPEDTPSIILTTRVHIPVLIQAEPKTLKWSVGEEATPKKIRITMNHTEPIRILRVSGAVDVIQQELKTLEEGKLYELVLTPKDTKNPAIGIFRVETDCSVEARRTQQVFALIRKN